MQSCSYSWFLLLMEYHYHYAENTISLLLCPGRGAKYCDQLVCLSVSLYICVSLSVYEHIPGTVGPITMKFCAQIPCDHGSVLFWRRCATLCTSGFIDDVTFCRNGPYGDAWLAAVRYRDGVWCLRMPCWYIVNNSCQKCHLCVPTSTHYKVSRATIKTAMKLYVRNFAVSLTRCFNEC